MSNDSSWPKAITDLEGFLDRVGLKCERCEEVTSFRDKLLQYDGELVNVRASQTAVFGSSKWQTLRLGRISGMTSRYFETCFLGRVRMSCRCRSKSIS